MNIGHVIDNRAYRVLIGNFSLTSGAFIYPQNQLKAEQKPFFVLNLIGECKYKRMPALSGRHSVEWSLNSTFNY
jgi:hypothetical protein